MVCMGGSGGGREGGLKNRYNFTEIVACPPSSFRDAPLGAGPESMITIVAMDSVLVSLRSRPGTTGVGRTAALDSSQVPPGFGWIATISKPRFKASIKLTTWGDNRSQP